MRASRYANRCESSEEAEIERQWHVGREQLGRCWDEVLFPRGRSAFILRSANDPSQRELVAGQRGLIPWFAKSAALRYSTNNARSEDLAHKWPATIILTGQDS